MQINSLSPLKRKTTMIVSNSTYDTSIENEVEKRLSSMKKVKVKRPKVKPAANEKFEYAKQRHMSMQSLPTLPAIDLLANASPNPTFDIELLKAEIKIENDIR